jgi:hypothetical protein
MPVVLDSPAVQSDSGAVDALTSDEQAELDTQTAGPPAPKSFETWVENGEALASDDEFDQEVYEAATAQPERLGAIFRIARETIKKDPSIGSVELKRALRLPTGEPSLQQSLTADREERALR